MQLASSGGRIVLVLVWTLLSVVLVRWLLLLLCEVTDRWFTPHFSVLARFCISRWTAHVACPEVCQPIWLACWIDTPERSSSSVARSVQDAWDAYWDELGLVPPHIVLALGDAVSGSCVLMIFEPSGARVLRLVFFRAYCLAGGPTEAGSSALGRGLLRIRRRRLGGRAVGRSGAGRMFRVNQK